MNVFISWSGERSRRVAELLKFWLKCNVQACEPWLSTEDIDRGAIWFSQISAQLKESAVGIICVTSENKNNPWILFEAGALAKGLESSRVIPLLIDLQSTNISGPLAQFNHALANREGLKTLVRTVNSLSAKLGQDILTTVFDRQWQDFESAFKAIIESTDGNAAAPEPEPADTLQTILELMHSMNGRLRAMESERRHTDAWQDEIAKNLKTHYFSAPSNKLFNLILQDELKKNKTNLNQIKEIYSRKTAQDDGESK